MKLLVLPESTNALIILPATKTFFVALRSAFPVSLIEAKTAVVAEVSFLDLELQAILKWPFFWHEWQVASRAGHLNLGCNRRLPQKKHFELAWTAFT